MSMNPAVAEVYASRRPKCERFGRGWVCSEAEGEDVCAWCQAEQWHTYNDELIGAFRLREAWIASLREPYRDRFKYHGTDRVIRDLVAEYGSAPAAIAWIRSDPIYLGDFEHLIVPLECWDMTVHEAHLHMHKRWAT